MLTYADLEVDWTPWTQARGVGGDMGLFLSLHDTIPATARDSLKRWLGGVTTDGNGFDGVIADGPGCSAECTQGRPHQNLCFIP